jgi:hypothetical protein
MVTRYIACPLTLVDGLDAAAPLWRLPQEFEGDD